MSRGAKGSELDTSSSTVMQPWKYDEDEGDGLVTTYMVVPPDGGWGWVVTAASFMSNVIVDGIIFSFGMYLTPISESLGESKATVTIVGSLLTGFYFMAGPFVSALANRYGFRLVTIFGSLLACTSFVVSYFATSALYLCISYGFLGGVGFGLIYVPSVITVGFYFERWRAMATGIAVCGTGIGTFIMPPLVTKLVHELGWRGSLLVLAGLVLNCILIGLLYRPLKPMKISVPKVAVDPESKPSDQTSLMMRIKNAQDDQTQNSASLVSTMDNLSFTADNPIVQRRLLKANNNNTYPTASQALANSWIMLSGSQRISSLSLSVSTGAGPSFTKAQKRVNAPLYADSLLSKTSSHLTEENASVTTQFQNPITVETKSSDMMKKGSDKASTQKKISRMRTIFECSSCRSHKSTATKDVGVRPFYRDDIFFSGSLARVPQYTSQVSSVGYHMSVSRLPTKSDVEEEHRAECNLCSEATQRTLATMLDFSLLQSATFLVLAISGFVTMMGFYVPFMYITDRAKMSGTDENLAVYLVSAMGIANTIGRVVCGVISSFPIVDSLLINNVALSIGGVATIVSTLSSTNAYLFTYASVFGLSTACFISLRSIIIVDLLGLDKLTNAFGLLLLFQGMAAAIGSPLAGAFMEMTKSYDASFYLAGSFILLSGILCYPLNWINKWEKKKNKQNAAAAV